MKRGYNVDAIIIIQQDRRGWQRVVDITDVKLYRYAHLFIAPITYAVQLFAGVDEQWTICTWYTGLGCMYFFVS